MPLFITAIFLLTEKAKEGQIPFLCMILVCSPWNSGKNPTKDCMHSQHIMKKSIHFSTYINIFKVFAACLHSTAAATLSYSTSLSMCAKVFWHGGHYILSYLTYDDLSGGQLERQQQMENMSWSVWVNDQFSFLLWVLPYLPHSAWYIQATPHTFTE